MCPYCSTYTLWSHLFWIPEWIMFEEGGWVWWTISIFHTEYANFASQEFETLMLPSCIQNSTGIVVESITPSPPKKLWNFPTTPSRETYPPALCIFSHLKLCMYIVINWRSCFFYLVWLFCWVGVGVYLVGLLWWTHRQYHAHIKTHLPVHIFHFLSSKYMLLSWLNFKDKTYFKRLKIVIYFHVNWKAILDLIWH